MPEKESIRPYAEFSDRHLHALSLSTLDRLNADRVHRRVLWDWLVNLDETICTNGLLLDTLDAEVAYRQPRIEEITL